MDPRLHNSDAHGPWADELPDLLRAAVGQLRDEPVPADACQRALDRATQRPPRPQPRRPWPTSRISLVVAGAVAAALLGYLHWHSSDPVLVRHDHSREKERKKYDVVQTTAANNPSPPSGVYVYTKPRVVMHGQSGVGNDLLPVGLGHLAGNWSEWDRV